MLLVLLSYFFRDRLPGSRTRSPWRLSRSVRGRRWGLPRRSLRVSSSLERLEKAASLLRGPASAPSALTPSARSARATPSPGASKTAPRTPSAPRPPVTGPPPPAGPRLGRRRATRRDERERGGALGERGRARGTLRLRAPPAGPGGVARRGGRRRGRRAAPAAPPSGGPDAARRAPAHLLAPRRGYLPPVPRVAHRRRRRPVRVLPRGPSNLRPSRRPRPVDTSDVFFL